MDRKVDEGRTFSWDDLLEYIDDRRVIPIIGWDVMKVVDAGETVGLDGVIAERLAVRLGLPPPGRNRPDPLNDVVAQHEASGGRTDHLYSRVRAIMREPLPVPEALRQLARIPHFKLFISTTFDGLLERALAEADGTGESGVLSLAYSLAEHDDLPAGFLASSQRCVFHLLGRSRSTIPDCVLCQEHMLEYLHHLQRQGVPEHLADLLRQSHLLLIGNRLNDWVVRFLIRVTKGERLIAPRGCSEILADNSAEGLGELSRFLRCFSPSTQLPLGGDATAFVAELSERYAQRHPRRPMPEDIAPSARADVNTMPHGAVFISYASEDVAAAARLHRLLGEAGIDAWFDKQELGSGDDFTAKISRNIRGCSVFMPLISRNTQARQEGYFRQEWSLAVARTSRMHDSVKFIVPVSIDGTPSSESSNVPERFLELQWAHLPNGECTPGFLEAVREIVRDAHRRSKVNR